MSTLVVVSYDNKFQADEVRLHLLKLQKDYLVSVEDAVIATKNADGKVKLHQMYSLTAAGAASGGFWGLLIGVLFLNPLFGFAVGAGAGAVAGALSDVGINDKFMKEVASKLTPNSSMLFLLLNKIVFDKVLDELRGAGGTIIQTSLSHTDEAKLRHALANDGITESALQNTLVKGEAKVNEMLDKTKAKLNEVVDNNKDSIQKSVKEGFENGKVAVEEFVDKGKVKFQEAVESGKERMHGIIDSGKEKVQEVVETVETKIENVFENKDKEESLDKVLK